jgi:hypothetical protein
VTPKRFFEDLCVFIFGMAVAFNKRKCPLASAKGQVARFGV